MERVRTTYLVADHMICSLGFSTEETLAAIEKGRSGIAPHQECCCDGHPLPVAKVDRTRLQQLCREYGLPAGNTPLEQMFILCIQEVCSRSGADLTSARCGLILSTTKGNIAELKGHTTTPPPAQVYLDEMGRRIAHTVNFGRQPIIVSNACISGVSALIVGKRLIENNTYDQVVVAGGDELSPFITSGFASFKSLSEHICKPYDAQRDGLNLGEGTAAVVLSAQPLKATDTALLGGAVSNDANHISGPSRTGDGLYLAIQQAMDEAGMRPEDIDFVNAHGTATVYNDEMESKAIHLSGLEQKPVRSLKPYLGHTLGAAGVIETILCARELQQGILFGTPGYETPGTPYVLNICPHHRSLPLHTCVKTVSGFGGCNAAIVLTRRIPAMRPALTPVPETETVSRVDIANGHICCNGTEVFAGDGTDFPAFIRAACKATGESNMKFFKMDDLAKLAYTAALYLLRDRHYVPEHIGSVLANRSSSLHTDARHQQLIDNGGEEAASPAVFVYTLPNVAAGEVCIRHKMKNESTFFIQPSPDPTFLQNYARDIMRRSRMQACIIGWCELDEGHYEASFTLIENKSWNN